MIRSNIIQILTDYRQFQIFILGIFSAMPLGIIYTTLAAWMTQANIDLAIITSFALARVFYSLKMFWAPFVDHIKIPLLNGLGRRKSWICLMFAIVSIIVFSYGSLNPAESTGKIYILTLLLAFFSATLDVAIDAFRIDTTAREKLSLAAANAVFGYRIGLLIVGAGAFYVATDYGWKAVFTTISCLYAGGIFFVLTLTELDTDRKNPDSLSLNFWKTAIIDPFKDFFKRKHSILILSAVIFYKFSDATVGVVATPFYMKLGFSLKEILWVAKLYGVIAILCGAYIGGIVMLKCGNIKGLVICGFVQGITNLMFIWLNYCGHNMNALITTITVENIASGMGDTALVGYLSYLCNRRFSATQYALLASAAGLFSHSIVAVGGMIVNFIGWDNYFIMTVFLALPGIIMLVFLDKKFKTS